MTAMCDALAGVLVMLCLQRWVLLHEWGARRERRRLLRGQDAASSSEEAAAKGKEPAVYIGANWVGVLGGGLYSLSPLVWLYSVQAEVFAMNNMFASLLLYLIIRFNETRNPAVAYLGAFTIGVGLTNQHTLVLYAVPVVVWALLQDRGALCAPRHFAVMTALGLIGLVPYVFLWTHVNYAPLGMRARPLAWPPPLVHLCCARMNVHTHVRTHVCMHTRTRVPPAHADMHTTGKKKQDPGATRARRTVSSRTLRGGNTGLSNFTRAAMGRRIKCSSRTCTTFTLCRTMPSRLVLCPKPYALNPMP